MQVDRTEIIWDSLDPDFVKSVEVEFVFERKQLFKVECRHAGNKTGTEYQLLGTVPVFNRRQSSS